MKPALPLILLLVSTMFIISCGKEVSVEPPVDPPVNTPDTIPSGENGGLLKKMIYKADGANDSMVISYIYDDRQRLSERNMILEGRPQTDRELQSASEKFYRNSEGVIEKIKLITKLFYTFEDAELHYDVEFNVHYDKSASQYIYAIETGTGEGNQINDSIAYQYNNNSQIDGYKDFNFNYDSNTYRPRVSIMYSYDSKGNVKNVNGTYLFNGKTSSNTSFEYDDKINPENWGNELFLMGREVLFFTPGVNNITKSVDALYGENSYSIAYTYNLHDKPVSATMIYDTGEKYITTYFYQK